MNAKKVLQARQVRKREQHFYGFRSEFLRVSPRFVRMLRKGLLEFNGTTWVPAPGNEEEAEHLRLILKALQQGAYDYAIEYAAQIGYELEEAYADYRAKMAEAKALCSNWEHVQLHYDKFRKRLEFTSWEREPVPVKQPGTVSRPKLEKFEADLPKWRRVAR